MKRRYRKVRVLIRKRPCALTSSVGHNAAPCSKAIVRKGISDTPAIGARMKRFFRVYGPMGNIRRTPLSGSAPLSRANAFG